MALWSSTRDCARNTEVVVDVVDVVEVVLTGNDAEVVVEVVLAGGDTDPDDVYGKSRCLSAIISAVDSMPLSNKGSTEYVAYISSSFVVNSFACSKSPK